MARLSIDSEQRKTGSRASAIVHYQINSDHWLYREEADPDTGRDCILELSENNRWNNDLIECQIKGSRKPKELLSGDAFTYALETRTIRYALSCRNAFVLFYVDIVNELAYYLPVQDYFINNILLFEKLYDQDTINVHIPKTNLLGEDDYPLKEIARSLYIDGPGPGLKRYLQDRLFGDRWE